MTTQRMEIVELATLRPWNQNPRKHGPGDLKPLERSLKEFGWGAPIVAQAGTNRILAGHGRYQAALNLGLTHAPAVFMDVDDQKAAAYTVADNRLAENSSWGWAELKNVLSDLNDGEFDLTLTGFGESDLQSLVDGEVPETHAEEPQHAGGTWKCPQCGYEGER